MASIVSAGTTSATALNMSADTTGILQLASNNGTVGLTLNASQNVGIGTASPAFGLSVEKDNGSGYVALFRKSASDVALTIQTTGSITQIQGLNAALSSTNNIAMQISGGNVGIGTNAPAEKLQVAGSICTTSNANNFNVLGGQFDFATSTARIASYNSTGSSISFYTNASGGSVSEKAIVDANTFYIGMLFSGKRNFDFALNGDAQKKGAFNQPDTAQPYGYIDYYYGATRSGYILWNSTSLSLTNLSDYRLKENVQPMTGALAKVVALNPVTYTWKSNGEAGRGFIAHELQEVAPECVRGDKDAVDEDGNPSYQGIDTTILISTLAAAIKELNAKVTALENK